MEVDYLAFATPEERTVVAELKKRLDNDLYNDQLKNDDEMFIRFARARELNVDLAEDMLRKHLIWRKQYNIDTLLTDFKPNQTVMKYLPNTRFGVDKEGAVLRYFDFGRADFKGIMKCTRVHDLVKVMVWSLEEDTKILKEQSMKLGKPITQWNYIVNFEGFNFIRATHKPTIEFLLSFFYVYEANYPERLKFCRAINSSIYFHMVFSIIKPLLSGKTAEKIIAYGKDDWKSVFLNEIDSDVLPMFLGGSRTDPDGNPLCTTIMRHGEDVPRDCYLTKSENRISGQPGSKKIVVSRMSKEVIEVEVDRAGSFLEWEFETESRDIKFGLRFGDKATTEIVPMQRIDAHLLAETGMYKCEKPGTYYLVFDNAYSWMHRKEIHYKLSLLPPTEKLG